MIEKILNGYYKAKFLRKRLCDVRIVVWSETEPKTIESISYQEYWKIKDMLIGAEELLCIY